MTLPKAPPRRRVPGFPPAHRPQRSTSARLRGIVKEHEKEERPFDPERRGSWRGSRRDLVVNPGQFHKDLEELIIKRWGRTLHDPELALKETKRILKGGRPDRVMKELDELLDTHGVEYVPGIKEEIAYLNTGDTYEPTIMYSSGDNKYFVSDWGSLVEASEPGQFDDAWDNWIRGEVERCIRRDIDHDIDLTGSEKEDLAAELDDFDDEELKKTFRASVNDVKGAEISHESDGSVFVSRMREACSETADRVITKLRGQAAKRSRAPNAKKPEVELFPDTGRGSITARVTMGSVQYERTSSGKWETYGGGAHGAHVRDPEFIAELNALVRRA